MLFTSMSNKEVTALLCAFLVSTPAFAESELAEMDLEQLMNMNITSVSKREQTFGNAAAAIYTISQEDIRRAGATSLPELLKQAPGIEVARINPGIWAITARGFNSQVANRLLVLIDGRSIYAPLFSGVYWDEQMPPLDDIKRIEIIRGPGASLWGSNAVNGVINIVTYDSEQTQGLRAVAGAGNEEEGYVRARYGAKSERLTGRVNVQFRSVDSAIVASDGAASDDDYSARQVGSRLDWRPAVTDKGTLDIGYTETHRHMNTFIPKSIAAVTDARDSFGAHSGYVLGNWLHEMENGDGMILQSYFELDDRVDSLNTSERFTADYELQYNHEQTLNHRLTWGLEYRYVRYVLGYSFVFNNDDATEKSEIATAFVQDEYRISDAVNATLGVKLEEGSATEAEYQPSLRLAWQLADDATLWGAVSRAVRTPSLFEGLDTFEYRRGYNGDRQIYRITQGNNDLKSEILYAYEAGLRFEVNNEVLVDIATFVNEYSRLYTPVLTGEKRENDPYPFYQAAFAQFNSVSDGRGEGVEIAADYISSDSLRVKTTYTYYDFEAHSEQINDAVVLPTTAQRAETQSPEHQASLVFYHNLPRNWELDWSLRYVDDIVIDDNEIPAYTDVSVRINKKLSKHLDVSLIGKNLFDDARVEFIDIYYGPYPTELERSIYLQVSWR